MKIIIIIVADNLFIFKKMHLVKLLFNLNFCIYYKFHLHIFPAVSLEISSAKLLLDNKYSLEYKIPAFQMIVLIIIIKIMNTIFIFFESSI